MNKLNFLDKRTGDTLEAQEWNLVVTKVDELVDVANTGGWGGGGSGGSSEIIDSTGVLSISSKGNVTVNSNKNINIEPAWDNNVENYNGNYGDFAVKPGDDIQFCSHHREPKKRDKVVVKAIDGSDNPVKLEIGCGELSITTKGKSLTLKKNKTTGGDTPNDYMFKPSDAKTLDVKVLTGETLDSGTADERDERGYLKVRAQAIDLRCEKHGGIALQPKGYDSDGNMNKIKFEHGGGDGLEFGTFNTEKTSIYTNEYRFKKDGIWKMATRETEPSGKDIIDEREGGLKGLEATGALKYKKNNLANNQAKEYADTKDYESPDDFYDFIDVEDAQTTTKDIIQTAASLNNPYIETSLSSTKKNLKIASKTYYKIIASETSISSPALFEIEDITKSFSKEDLKEILDSSSTIKLNSYIETNTPFIISADNPTQYILAKDINPKISIESDEEVDINAKYGDVVITSGDSIKQEAPEIRLNAMNADKTGGMVNFGVTLDVIFLTNKLTASLNVESSTVPTKIKMMLQNNYLESVFYDNTVSKFRIPVKHLYLDNNHVTELTPSNYANGLPVYFADGTRLPANYTCFIATQSTSGTVITTTVYKTGTKGSENVLKKNLGEPVAVYTNDSSNTSSNTSSLGVATNNSILNIEFEDYSFAGTGYQTVASEEFVTVKEVELGDVIDIIDELKTMKANNQGPWTTT